MSENDKLLHDLFIDHVKKTKLFHENSKISNKDLLKLYGLHVILIIWQELTHTRDLRERKR